MKEKWWVVQKMYYHYVITSNADIYILNVYMYETIDLK